MDWNAFERGNLAVFGTPTGLPQNTIVSTFSRWGMQSRGISTSRRDLRHRFAVILRFVQSWMCIFQISQVLMAYYKGLF